VAVPTGEYDATAKVDLSPVLGVIENLISVEIRQPEGDVLATRLEELQSEEANVRRRAAIDLRYFPEDGEKVVPALLGRLDDESGYVRSASLSVLASYPEQAGKHADRFLSILEGGEKTTIGERLGAAHLLARTAPLDPRYEAALQAALKSATEIYQLSYQAALTNFRRRAGVASGKAE